MGSCIRYLTQKSPSDEDLVMLHGAGNNNDILVFEFTQ